MNPNLAFAPVVAFKSAKPRCAQCVRGIDGKIATHCVKHDRKYAQNGVQAMNPTQVRAFLSAARATSARNYALILTMFLHGLRISEILNLTVGDADFVNGRLRIKPLKRRDGRVFFEEFRTFGDFDERAALVEYLKSRSGAVPSEPLFMSRKSATRAISLNRSSVFTIYSALAASVELPIWLRHPHSARHSFGRNCYLKMVELGAVNLPLLTSALRHSNPQSTNVYLALTSEDVHSGVSGLLAQL